MILKLIHYSGLFFIFGAYMPKVQICGLWMWQSDALGSAF
jgi:hypothetical protein